MPATTRALHTKEATGRIVARAALAANNPYLGMYLLGGEMTLHDQLPATGIYQLGLVPIPARIIRVVMLLHNYGSNTGISIAVQKNGTTFWKVPDNGSFFLISGLGPRAMADAFHGVHGSALGDVSVAAGDSLTLSIGSMDANARGLSVWAMLAPYSAYPASITLTD